MKKGKISFQALIYQILEFLGILKVVLDVDNNRIRMIEMIELPWFKKIISHKTESLSDNSRVGFMIERFLEKYSTHQIRRIHLGLSSVSVIPMFFPLPGIPKDKIASVIQWQVDKLVPLSPNELYTGFRVLSKIENLEIETKGWNVMAITARKTEIHLLTETLDNLGIIIQSIYYTPLNFIRLFQTTPQPTAEGLILSTAKSSFLIIIHLSHIVHFSQMMEPISPISDVKLKNIVKFFTEFIRRGGSFLSKISLMGNIPEEEKMDLIQMLTESLNIIVVPVNEDEIEPSFRSLPLPFEEMDLPAVFLKSVTLPPIPLPVKQKAQKQDLVFRWLTLFLIFFNFFSLLTLPKILKTFREYRVYHLAKTKKISEIKSREIIEIAEKLEKIKKLHEYEKQQKILSKKIADLKKRGITSSNVKTILGEISKLIPNDVWLSDLSIEKGKGIIKGKSLSTGGLETFVIKLVNSPFLDKVVLKKAELSQKINSGIVEFSILFEVRL